MAEKNNFGKVYWITGLSGAGKTTVGSRLYAKLQKKKNNLVILDGDELRKVFKNSDYSKEGREKLAFQYSRLCCMLSEQGIDVICCTIAMFDNCRKWNRENISNYYEVYLEVPVEKLIERDQKGLYSKALKNEISEVMGINLDFEEPKNPDIVIVNDGTSTPDEIVDLIINSSYVPGGVN